MKHTQETIDHIRELLNNSGLSAGDTLEEMLDHYLSDIEWQIGQGTNQQMANNATFQKIKKTNLTHINEKKNYRSILAIIAVCSLLLLLIICKSSLYSYSNEETIWEEFAPDGWPLVEPKAHITANFGLHMHPVLKSQKQHNGVDIKAKIGAPVLATGRATVKEIGYTKQAGNYVILQHNDRYTTRYCHLSTIEVQVNQSINKGYIIGKVGSTGMSTAPHLHYEILDGSSPIDPLECARA